MDYLTNPKDYNSNWEWTKSNSTDHFDNDIEDRLGDYLWPLGKFEGDWSEDLSKIIEESHAVNWSTRQPVSNFSDTFLDMEEYDIKNAGGDEKGMVAQFNRNALEYDSTRKMIEVFGLDNLQARLHVQTTGQMWHRHIDKLYKFHEEDPSKILRIHIMLTDWEPGHFFQYGNLDYRWKAGDVNYFDWRNLPHSTANTTFAPRVSLQLTGVKTQKTEELFSKAPFKIAIN